MQNKLIRIADDTKRSSGLILSEHNELKKD